MTEAAGRPAGQRPPEGPGPTRRPGFRSAPRRWALGRGPPPAPCHCGPALCPHPCRGTGGSVMRHRGGDRDGTGSAGRGRGQPCVPPRISGNSPPTPQNKGARESLSGTRGSGRQPAGPRRRAHASPWPPVGPRGGTRRGVGVPGSAPRPPARPGTQGAVAGWPPRPRGERPARGARAASGERRRAGAGLTVRSSWVRSFMLPGVAAAPAAAV